MQRDNDRNLLFAVLAVQLKGVPPERVMNLASAWTVDPSKSLPERFREAGVLPPEDVALLENLVNEAVRVSGDDPARAIHSIHGGDTLRRSFVAALRPAPAPHDATKPMEDERFQEEVELTALEETPGRYSQISEHGKGGMGRVLLVHDQYLGRDIALKELLLPHDGEYLGPAPSPMRETTAMFARFLQEARITSQLEHPSIVPVYEVGRRTNGTLYYTMKLVRGRTMALAIRDAGTLERRLRLLSSVVDVCQALAYAHSRGVIHRDIKPSNIMIGEFGETVMLDWGLAKLRGHDDVYAEKLKETMRLIRGSDSKDTPRTSHGDAVGTPHYMPPEQARGEIEKLDQRSDVYAVGAVLYELLTGAPPYTGSTADAVVAQVLAKPPKPVRELTPDAPPELVSICERAMARDPEGRYPGMAALRDELVRFQSGAIVEAYTYTTPQRVARWYRRHRLAANAAAAIVVAVLAAGVVSYINVWQARGREQAQRVLAEESRNAAVIARDNERAARDDAEHGQYLAQLRLAQTHLDGHQMRLAIDALDRTPPARRDWAWGYLSTRARPEIFNIYSEKSVIYWSKFSPDGRYIVNIRNPETPGLYDGVTGAHLRDFEGEFNLYNNAAFSPDGARFAAIGEGGVLDLWDVATGKRLHRLTHTAMGYAMAFAPGGNPLWASYDDGRLIAWDTDAGRALRTIETANGPIGGLHLLAGGLLLAMSNTASIAVWNAETGERAYGIDERVAWPAPDGTAFAAQGPGGLRLCDAATGNTRVAYAGAGGGIFSVNFNAGGTQLLSCSLETGIQRWSAAQPDPLETYQPFAARPDPAVYAYFLDGGERVLGCFGNNHFAVWDTETAAFMYDFSGQNEALTLAELAPDGRRLLSASAHHTFQVFDAMQPAGQAGIAFHPVAGNSYAMRVAVAADDAYAAIAMDNGTVRVLNLRDLSVAAQLEGAADSAQHVAWAPDARRIVHLPDPQTAAVFEVVSGQRTAVHQGHTHTIRAVAVSAAGEHAASGDEGGTIRVWRLDDGALIHEATAGSAVHALAFTGNGTRIAAGCGHGEVRILDLTSKGFLKSVPAHASPVVGVAVAKGAPLLATIGQDGSFGLWNLDTGDALGHVPSEESHIPLDTGVLSVEFSHDDRYLIVRGSQQPFRIFDAEKLNLLINLFQGRCITPLSDGRRYLEVLPGGVAAIGEVAAYETAAAAPNRGAAP